MTPPIARLVIGCLCSTWLAAAAPVARGVEPESQPATPAVTPAVPGTVDFERDVKPIFAAHCYECHGAEKQKKKLRLDVKAVALRAPLIVPGDSAGSKLYESLVTTNAKKLMPPPDEAEALAPGQIATIKAWIDQGAAWPAPAGATAVVASAGGVPTLAGPDVFMRPNWHVILVHHPIALLSLGLLIEMGSFMWRRSAVRTAGRWMLLLGTLLAVPASLSGIYAYQHAVGDARGTWAAQVAASTLHAEQWEFLNRHAWVNGAVTVALLAVVVAWVGSSDLWRRRLYWPFLLFMALSMGALTWGTWHAGEAVYRWGTGVARVAPPGAEPERTTRSDWRAHAEYFVPPMQAHLALTGLCIAASAVALALSVRAITSRHPDPALTLTGNADTGFGTDPDAVAALAVEQSNAEGAIAADAAPGMHDPGTWPGPHVPPAVPAARFWVLAALLALLTGVAGLWMVDTWTWAKVRGTLEGAEIRPKAHVVLGAAAVLLPLLLAVVARWWPRKKVLLGTLSGLLLLAVAAQVWVGILLMLDTDAGSLTKWNAPAAPAAVAGR